MDDVFSFWLAHNILLTNDVFLRRPVLDALPLPLFFWDPEAHLVYANPAGEALARDALSRERATGTKAAGRRGGGAAAGWRQAFSERALAGIELVAAWQHLQPRQAAFQPGGRRLFLLPLHNLEEEPVGLLGFVEPGPGGAGEPGAPSTPGAPGVAGVPPQATGPGDPDSPASTGAAAGPAGPGAPGGPAGAGVPDEATRLGQAGDPAPAAQETPPPYAAEPQPSGLSLELSRLRATNELAASTAHELRNLLTAVTGFLQLLDQQLEGTPKRELRLALDQLRRAARLVQYLLVTMRRPAGDGRALDLARLVRETVRTFEARAAAQGVQVRLDLPDDELPVAGDGQQMKQVLVNLLQNALDAMPDGGELAVFPEWLSPHVLRLHVADTGPGVRPEDRDRIFQPFYTTKEEGTGLGLAISRQIVRQWEGELDVVPAAGGGADFRVTLLVALDAS